MTLSAFAWNIVRTYTLTPGRRYSFGCRYRLGTATNLVMYVSAADNDYVGVTGTFLGTPAQGVWSTARLDFLVPPGGIAKLHFGAFGGSISRLVQQSAGTLDLYSMQIRASAGLAGPHGLHRNHGQHAHHQQHGQRRELYHGGRRVHGHANAATAASFAATGALTGATLTITGAASAGPLDCESLDCTFTATSGGVSTAPQLFASNTLTVTNTSDFSDDLFPTKNWAGKLQVSNSAAPTADRSCSCWANRA